MKRELLKIAKDLDKEKINEQEARKLLLGLLDIMPRSFGMVRWHSNEDEDVACVDIEKAKEYVEKYNKLAGYTVCYVDTEIYTLLNEA